MTRPASRARAPRGAPAAARVAPVLALASVLALAAPPRAHAAGPVFWDYPAGVPLRACELDGASLDEHGRLAPGLAATAIALDGPEVVWCLRPDADGGAWLGSGHDGGLWRVTSAGAARLVATLPEPEIFCAVTSGGHLYAGGGPDGLVFRVQADGAFVPWADLPAAYVWALVAASDGTLYAATGTPAALWRLDGRLQATQLCELGATHAMDAALLPSGRLLVVTQGPGLIWDVDPRAPASARVLWEAAQDELRQLASGPDGAWYALGLRPSGETGGAGGFAPETPTADTPEAATAPTPTRADRDVGGGRNGRAARAQPLPDLPGVTAAETGGAERAALYRVAPDGAVTRHWSGEAIVAAVAHHPRWGWLAAGARDRARGLGAVYALEPPGAARPLATWEGGEAIDIVALPEAGRDDALAWVALARPGGVLRLTGRTAAGAVAVAPPIDGGGTIRWARLHWEGETPDGSRVSFAVRGGPRAQPDATWSAWSEPWSERDRALPLPPSRFLQWRAEFAGGGAGARVAAVTVSGVEPNAAPRIQRFEPQPPGQLTAAGPFGDSGSVTEAFPSGLRAEYNLESRRDRRADPLVAQRLRALRTFIWQAADPNDDRLVFRLEYRPVAERAWRPVGDETAETVRAWDTAGVPDGWYVLRLTASDSPDNAPGQELQDERLTTPLLVDNTPPEVAEFSVARTPDGLRLRARVADRTSPLAEAWLELPDGRTARLDPRDGVCDSAAEEFDVALVCPAPGRVVPEGAWRVRAGFVDRAGNVGRAEGEPR